MLRKKALSGTTVSLIGALCMSVYMIAAPPDTRVADAAKSSDKDTVRALLEQGVDVNAAQGDGMTALHWAAFNNDLEMTEMLLYAGAKVSAATRVGNLTPLLLAAENGSADVVERLLKAGSDVNATNYAGMTAVMLAALAGDANVVSTLIRNGGDPNAKEKIHGQTALMFAAANNRDQAITALIAGGADTRIGTKTVQPPALPSFGGRGRGGRGAPAPGAASTPPGAAAPAPGAAATPPGAAATTSEAARKERGAAPASRGAAPAGRGAAPQEQRQQNNDEGRDVTPDPSGGMTPLLYAAREGHVASARALLDGGADVNERSADQSTPLLLSSINGHFDLAMFLLERGADPKLASMAGATPLFGAVNVQWAPKVFYPQPNTRREKTTLVELIEALLAHGADPNARLKKDLWYTGYNGGGASLSAESATAFWRAAHAGDNQAMRALIAGGADPLIASAEGVTPLLACAGAGFSGTDEVIAPQGRMPAMRYMVEELKLDVNAVDTKGGHSAIHHAAHRGDNEMLLYLVSKGARVDIVAKNGQTTADMANGPRQRIQPFAETIALLQALGAKNNNKCVSC